MVIRPPNNKGGWFENPDATGKAPEHKKVANKNKLNSVLRRPMIREVETKPRGYWTYDQTIVELKKVIAEIGHFPLQNERCDLLSRLKS